MQWWEHVSTFPEGNPGCGLLLGYRSSPGGLSSPTASALESRHAFTEAFQSGLGNKTQFTINLRVSFKERSTSSACFHDLDEPHGEPGWLLPSWLRGEF